MKKGAFAMYVLLPPFYALYVLLQEYLGFKSLVNNN